MKIATRRKREKKLKKEESERSGTQLGKFTGEKQKENTNANRQWNSDSWIGGNSVRILHHR